jgi:hypothetical protein
VTFAQMVTAVKDYAGLTSAEAETRVGKSINRHYRRVTSLIGLDAARFVTRSQTTTNGQQYVTFTEIETIDRILATSDSTAIRELPQITIDRQRTQQPHASQPTSWALRNTDADSVTVLLDTVPQTEYTLQADGWTTLSDLSGSDEPIFPESFHDVLVWFVLEEESLKKEKLNIAAGYRAKAEQLLADLRFHLADSPSLVTRQGGSTSSAVGGGSGGGGTLGATAYTQSALVTFDRGAGLPPFAVVAGATVVSNLIAETATKLSVSATDRLLGRDTAGAGDSEELTVGGGLEFTGSGGIQRSALTGDVTAAAGSGATTIANDAVTYAKLQNVSAASRLLGRGSAAGAGNVEELTAGSGLTISGTALSTTPAGADTQVLFNDGGAFAGDSGLTFNKTTDQLTLALINLTGGQIAFPASQSASAGANTLDDYEEGSWTPVIGGSGGTSGQTYGAQQGIYVKVGKLVVAMFRVQLSNKGTITTDAQIQGLPFTIENVSGQWNSTALHFENTAGNLIHLFAQLNINTTTATLRQMSAASTGTTAANTADIANTTQLAGVLVYRATS